VGVSHPVLTAQGVNPLVIIPVYESITEELQAS